MSQVYFKEYIDNGFPVYRRNKDVKMITLRGHINGVVCEFTSLIDARWFEDVEKPDKKLADIFARRAKEFISSFSEA